MIGEAGGFDKIKVPFRRGRWKLGETRTYPFNQGMTGLAQYIPAPFVVQPPGRPPDAARSSWRAPPLSGGSRITAVWPRSSAARSRNLSSSTSILFKFKRASPSHALTHETVPAFPPLRRERGTKLTRFKFAADPRAERAA